MIITFICTGNTCRSPMAEGICRKMLRERGITSIACRSCGISAFSGDSPSNNAVEAMKDRGIDISHHRASTLNPYIIGETDLAVCMTERHKAAVLRYFPDCRAVVPSCEISDPYGGDIDVYRQCAAQLSEYIKKLLDVLTAEIVPMSDEHIGGIAGLERLCFSAPWTEDGIREELSNSNSHFLAAVFDKKVLGYVGVQEICGEAYVANVAVHPEYRRMHLGERLISAAADGARERECEFISLEVRKSNAAAIALYEKQGYNVAGERKNFYSDPPEDGLIMTKVF